MVVIRVFKKFILLVLENEIWLKLLIYPSEIQDIKNTMPGQLGWN